MTLPHSYIICSTSRSGSTLLCDLLTETGVAGRPQSYFMKEFYADWGESLGITVSEWADGQAFDQTYLKSVLREGSGNTGCFGLRLQQQSLVPLSQRLVQLYPGKPNDSERFRAAFGTSSYIHLSRADKVAQAVSLLRARQSGLWHAHSDGSERERLTDPKPPQYDFQSIQQLVDELEKQDDAWTVWLEREEVRATRVTYESLAADPNAVIARLLTFLGRDASTADNIRPKTAILADDQSQEWVRRYRSDLEIATPLP